MIDFWDRRNPTPGGYTNKFKDEYYRHIKYANSRFTTNFAPGWRTDRGRLYILYGPPDEIDSHPTAKTGQPSTEHWTYRHIETVGDNVNMEFIDHDGDGDYRLTSDPHRKPNPPDKGFHEPLGLLGPQPHIEIAPLGDTFLTIPLSEIRSFEHVVDTAILSADGRTSYQRSNNLVPCPSTNLACGEIYHLTGPRLPSGSYILRATVTDPLTGLHKNYRVPFTVDRQTTRSRSRSALPASSIRVARCPSPT